MLAVLLSSLGTGLLGGCAPNSAWTELALPATVGAGVRPVTLAAYRAGVVVGTQDGAGRPGALVREGRSWTMVPVEGVSGYGKEGRWLAIAADGSDGLVAVAGARGGAHANVRWTVWRGDESGLREQEQSFYVFGGWGAGDLSGLVVTATTPLIVGSWESEAGDSGLGAAVWIPVAGGARWERQPTIGTALANTAQEMVALSGGSARVSPADQAILVGSVVRLSDPVSEQAIAFVGSPASGWQRIDLPGSGRFARAAAVTCDPQACTIVGREDDQLIVWRVDGSGTARRLTMPSLHVSERDRLAPPLLRDGRALLVLDDHRNPGATVMLSELGGGFALGQGPPGPVAGLASMGSTVLVLTGPADPMPRIWSLQL